MHRWSPLNERQRSLLARLGAGEQPGNAWKTGDWRSAYALRDRGLLTIRRARGDVRMEVTDAGRFYEREGHHPDDPVHARAAPEAETGPEAQTAGDDVNRSGSDRRSSASYDDRPIARARRAKASKLVERLVVEKKVTIRAPGEDELTEWRRVINYAKRHGFEPEGERIEKMRMLNGDLQISLVTGPHANSRRQTPVDAPPVKAPIQLRALHPVVSALRDDEHRLVMPSDLRRRALLLFQGLAAEAVRRGHEVRKHGVVDRRTTVYNGQYILPSHSHRSGELDVAVDDFAETVTVQQEYPQSTNPERSAKLVIEIGYDRAGRQRRWTDRKRWTVEDVLGAVLQEIETRAVEAVQRKAEEAKARAEREVRWRAAMQEAKEQAAQALLAEVLSEQAARWQEASALRAYGDALEEAIADAIPVGEAEMSSSRQWLAWIRRYVEAIDPLKLVPGMPQTREPTPEELKPYLQGWSPHGPEARRYSWDADR